MRTLIVTAADEAFMPLLRGLVLSLQPARAHFTDLACFDVGLSTESRAWVARHAAHVVEPRWDIAMAPAQREARPHLRALTVRPFVRDYFPGYDAYLWMDADTWLQEAYALDWHFKAAASGAMSLAPEWDRCYRQQPGIVGWRQERLQAYFGAAAAQRVLWDSYFNAGVFCLRDTAPHWQAWAASFAQGAAASGGVHCDDQASLNHALWQGGLDVHPLPPLANWLCHLGVPAYRASTGRFCEPFMPWQPIGIMHLTGSSKDLTLAIAREDGRRDAINLRFPEGEAPLR